MLLTPPEATAPPRVSRRRFGSRLLRTAAETLPMVSLLGWFHRSTAGARPQASGPDSAKLPALLQELGTDPHPDLNGIVVAQDGKLLAEAYFNGEDRDSLHDIRSATKSITSTLLGIAIDRGFVDNVDSSIAKYLPGVDSAHQSIRIRDLLNMRSGLDAIDSMPDSPGSEDRMDQSPDWLRFALSVPIAHPPGTLYAYASVNAFLAGAIVEQASGMRLDRFAVKYLFDPLGIRLFQWRLGPHDRGTGQGNLRITARDAFKIGQMVLDGGRFNGTLIVSESWASYSVASQVRISAVDPYADFYGFMWYTKNLPVEGRSVEVHFASGNGGNKIYIIPSRRMVVVVTSSAYNSKYGQKRSQSILLRILALAGPPTPSGRPL